MSLLKARFQQQVAIFDVIGGSLGTSPIIAGLTPDMVSVRYLNEAGSVYDTADQTLIKFAEVSITGYTHTLIIPLWGGPLTAPRIQDYLAH